MIAWFSQLFGWNRNLILAILLLAGGTFAYWHEFVYKPKQELLEEDKKKIFLLGENPIKSIRLIDGAKVFGFSCKESDTSRCLAEKNASWELIEPRVEKADTLNISNLLSTLNNITATEIIDLKDEAAPKRNLLIKEYGLDKEAREATGENAKVRRIEVEFQDGKKQIAYFGITHPIGESVFTLATVNGSAAHGGLDEARVLLIPSSFKAEFEFPLTHWRNKRLFDSPGSSFPLFEYESKSTKLRAEKREGLWILTTGLGEGQKPESVPGDAEIIDSLLANATYLSAKEFADEDKSSPAADKLIQGAQKVLTMHLRRSKDDKTDPSTVVFQMLETTKSGKPDKIFATVSNLKPLFELNPSAKSQILKTLKDLRMTKLISSTERVSANKLVFSGSELEGSGLTFLKDKSLKWNFEKPDPSGQPADSDKVERLLDLLSSPRIQEFIKSASAPEILASEKEGTKISLSTDEKADKRKLSIWKHADRFYARDTQSKRGEIFRIDDQLKNALPSKKVSFLKEAGSPAQPADGEHGDETGHEGHGH